MSNRAIARIRFHQLTFGSLVRIGWICNLFVWVPLWALAAAQSLLGPSNSFVFGDTPASPAQIVIMAVGGALLCALIGGLTLGLGGLVARVVNRVVPFGGIRFRGEVTRPD